MPRSRLLWFMGRRFRIMRRRRVRVRRPPSRASRLQYQEHKTEAREKILERLEYFNRHYAFSWKAVSIRNQKSRWGSCSKARTLSFNFRLILISPHLLDYVIVHELCHLAEFNHSRAFWARVSETVPDWKSHRAELKKIRL